MTRANNRLSCGCFIFVRPTMSSNAAREGLASADRVDVLDGRLDAANRDLIGLSERVFGNEVPRSIKRIFF